MKERDAEDRLGRAFRSMGDRAPVTEDECPTPEAIWAAVTGAADEGSVHRIVEHSATCPACAEDWRLARGADAVARGETASLGAGRPRVRPVWLAAAASLVLALAGGAYLLRGRVFEEGSPIRSAVGGDIRTLVPEGAALSRDDFLLRWSAAAEGSRYELRVVTEDAEEIAAVDGLTQAEYRLPPEALRTLEPGAKLLWRVQAVLPEGRRVASPTFVNAVR